MRNRDEKGDSDVTLFFQRIGTSRSPSEKTHLWFSLWLFNYTERVRKSGTQTLTPKVFANSSPGFALKPWENGAPKYLQP